MSPHGEAGAGCDCCEQSPEVPSLPQRSSPRCSPRASRRAPAGGARSTARRRSSAGSPSSSSPPSSAAWSAPKTLADEDTGNGESKRGDQIVEAAGFPDQTGETVLVQGKDGLKVGDPRFTAAVDDVVAQARADQGRRRGREPARAGVRRQRLRGRPLRARQLRAARRRGRGQGRRRGAARGRRSAAEAAPRGDARPVRRRVGREGDRRGVRGGLPEGRGRCRCRSRS